MNLKSWSLCLGLFCSAGLFAEGVRVEIPAVSFTKANPESVVNAVKESGNLGSIVTGKPREHLLAAFDYEFEIPKDGWYVFDVPHTGNMEYDIDNGAIENVYVWERPVNMFLKAGKHHLHVAKRNFFSAWENVNQLIFRESADEPRERISLTGERYLHNAVVGSGEPYAIVLESGVVKDCEFTVEIMDKSTGKCVAVLSEKLPGGKNYKKTLKIIPPKAGNFQLKFSADGKDITPYFPEYNVYSIDKKPFTAVGDVKKTLIQTIDCVKQAPDFGIGETRVVKRGFGSYRETGPVGWLAHMNAQEPNWFAYRLNTPKQGHQYLVEVDYPDDALRTYAISFRNSGLTTYPMAGGVETGHRHTPSNTMLTHTILGWAVGPESRMIIVNAVDGPRGAASQIRVYELESQELPMLVKPESGNRDFANWYEEGESFLGLFGCNYDYRTPEEFIKASDRWANTCAYMGVNVLYPTIHIYQFGLYPTKLNPFANMNTLDIAEIYLQTAEKYGMKVMFDFHPEARDLGEPDESNFLRNKIGDRCKRYPLFGPMHPKNHKFLMDMITQFVERYKHHPSFRGITVRQMTWQNHALNNFDSLDWGYDDCTVGCFEKDTGIKIPGISGPDDPKRFQIRYDFLTSAANRKKWVDWRCEKITEIYRELSEAVRKIRPDLVIRCNIGDSTIAEPGLENMTREYGIDPQALDKIPNLELEESSTYGRKDERTRNNMLGHMMNPDPAVDLFSTGNVYFEATSDVLLTTQLGFGPEAKNFWMSAVINPPERQMLERFALAVARFDSKALQDGGNAYTIGQPELRDFMKVYRSLPKLSFPIAAGADDPVTVRQNGRDGFMVNMMPYPVKCTIDGKKYELNTFELRRFEAPPVKKVTVELPQEEIARMNLWLTALKKHAAAPGAEEWLIKLAKEAEAAFRARKYWKYCALVDMASPKMDKAGILLPDFYRDGLPVTPERAIPAAKLAKFGKVEPASKHLPDWTGENIVSGAPLKISPKLSVPGSYRIKFGYACGGKYGGFKVFFKDKLLGTVISSGGKPFAGEESYPDILTCRDVLDLRFVPDSGKKAGLTYLELIPVYTPILPFRWRMSQKFPAKEKFTAEIPPEIGKDKSGWNPVSAKDTFIDLGHGAAGKVMETCFAVTYVYSPDQRKVRLAFGADYWTMIYVNGKAVKSPERKTTGAPHRGEETLDVSLNAGWNELLVKVGGGTLGFGFWMDISNMDDLRFSAEPKDPEKITDFRIPAGGKMLLQDDFEKEVSQKDIVWDGTGRESAAGKGAIRINGVYLVGTDKIQGGKTYALQGFFRTKNDSAQFRLQINWQDANGLIRPDLALPTVPTDYTFRRILYKAPVAADRATLYMGGADVWADCFWFGEVPENTEVVDK